MTTQLPLEDHPSRDLAQSILDELSVEITHLTHHTCHNQSPETPRPACLPVNTPDNIFCIRCLSKELLTRANKKGQAKTKQMLKDFYSQALDINLISRLLEHTAKFPQRYSMNKWVNFSEDIYQETKKLKRLERRQKYYLIRLEALDARK